MHFDVLVGGCSPSAHSRVDPYDIAGGLLRGGVEPTHDYYPGNGRLRACGENNSRVNCSPVFKNLLDADAESPNGFGAAHDVVAGTEDLLLKTFLAYSSVVFNVGNGQKNQYIHRYGYEWDGTQWQQFELSGPETVGDAWFVGEASTTRPRSE